MIKTRPSSVGHRPDNTRKPDRWSPTFSPLEPVFAPLDSHVPYAFREQFYQSPEDTFDVVLRGTTRHIWHRPRWLRPILWLASKGGILTPETGRDIPTTMRVIRQRDSEGRPYHTWARTFYFPRRTVRFNTSIIYDPEQDQTADMAGPGNSILIYWRARFLPPKTFTLDTTEVALSIGGRKVRLPRPVWQWMFGVVHHCQWVDTEREDMMWIETILWHPLVGYFFGYEGVFEVTREEHTISDGGKTASKDSLVKV